MKRFYYQVDPTEYRRVVSYIVGLIRQQYRDNNITITGPDWSGPFRGDIRVDENIVISVDNQTLEIVTIVTPESTAVRLHCNGDDQLVTFLRKSLDALPRGNLTVDA